MSYSDKKVYKDKEPTTTTVLKEDKIVIHDHEKDTKTTIIPPNKPTETITRAAFNIQEGGLPTNQDLDSFGDQVYELFEKSKKHAKDEKAERIIESAQGVVESVQQAILERNHDEKLQQIAKKAISQSKMTKNYPDLSKTFSNTELNRINEKFKDIVPLITKLGKFVISDRSFRELLISLIDVFTNTASRMNRNVDGSNLTEAIKQDIRTGDVDNVPPNTTDPLQHLAPNTKEHLQNIASNFRNYSDLPEEEKNELIERSLSVLSSIKTSEEYKTLLYKALLISDDIIELWNSFRTNPGLKKQFRDSTTYIDDIKVLIERTSGRSLATWEQYLGDLVTIKDEPKFKEVRHDIEDLLLDTENKYSTKQDFRLKFEKIRLEIQELNIIYKGLINNFFTESREIFMGIASDPVITGIKDNINRLIQEVFVDEMGNPSVVAMKSSFSRIRDCLFPILKDRLKKLDIPAVEVESPKYDFKISNVRFNLADLLPENFNIDTDFNVSFDLNKMKRNGDFNVRLSLEPFSTNLEKVKFYIKKKTGMKFKDYGKVTIKLKKAGIMVHFHVRLNKDKLDYFECTKVDSNLSGLKIKVIKSKHQALDKMATTLFLPTIRSQIEKLIDKKLKDTLNDEVCDRVNESLKDFDKKKKQSKKLKKQKARSKRLGESTMATQTTSSQTTVEQPPVNQQPTVADKLNELNQRNPRIDYDELERKKADSNLKRQFAKLDGDRSSFTTERSSEMSMESESFSQNELEVPGFKSYPTTTTTVSEGYQPHLGSGNVVLEEVHHQPHLESGNVILEEGHHPRHHHHHHHHHHKPHLGSVDVVLEEGHHQPHLESGNVGMKEAPFESHPPKVPVDTMGIKERPLESRQPHLGSGDLGFKEEHQPHLGSGDVGMKEAPLKSHKPTVSEGHHQPHLGSGDLGLKEQKEPMLPYEEDDFDIREGHHDKPGLDANYKPGLIAGYEKKQSPLRRPEMKHHDDLGMKGHQPEFGSGELGMKEGHPHQKDVIELSVHQPTLIAEDFGIKRSQSPQKTGMTEGLQHQSLQESIPQKHKEIVGVGNEVLVGTGKGQTDSGLSFAPKSHHQPGLGSGDAGLKERSQSPQKGLVTDKALESKRKEITKSDLEVKESSHQKPFSTSDKQQTV